MPNSDLQTPIDVYSQSAAGNAEEYREMTNGLGNADNHIFYVFQN